MFRQLEKLTIENEKLKKENKELKAENRWLRTKNVRLEQRIKTLEATIEARIKKAVEKATAPLLEKIEEKDKEILHLKSQLGKDSSRPSGGNGFKQMPNNRQKIRSLVSTAKKRGKNILDILSSLFSKPSPARQ